VNSVVSVLEVKNMPTEMGEYVVGGYLKEILLCDFVDFNVRVRGGGLEGLNELDVLGLRFSDNTAYLCEVTTHTQGALHGSYKETIDRIRRKHERQIEYARKFLSAFEHHHFMFWSPRVARGKLTDELSQINTLQLVINEDYTRCVRELENYVRKSRQDLGNPFLRALQILTCLREEKRPHANKSVQPTARAARGG
jgi:hypothetical protein